jgi:propionyl-CoA carboxylase alpha chain
MDKIIAACKQTGAEAVHPGYGFLSENAKPSRAALEEEGIVFIGPKHYSIERWATRSPRRSCAKEAKVNVIPGLQRRRSKARSGGGNRARASATR